MYAKTFTIIFLLEENRQEVIEKILETEDVVEHLDLENRLKAIEKRIYRLKSKLTVKN